MKNAKEETAGEYLRFFDNTARAILTYRDYDDMVMSAWLYLRRQGMYVFDLDGTLCDGRVDGVEFIDKLLDWFKDPEDSKRSMFLKALRKEVIRERSHPLD